VGGYVVAHLKRDIVQLGEKLRRILFSKCICFYWFLVFLKFWIFGILNTYFSTTISVISDLVLLSFELRILNFGFFKSHCQPLNFGFFLWSWALKTRLEGSVFLAGGVLKGKKWWFVLHVLYLHLCFVLGEENPKMATTTSRWQGRGSGALDLKRIFCFALYSTSVIVHLCYCGSVLLWIWKEYFVSLCLYSTCCVIVHSVKGGDKKTHIA
jgi:hypothetical protein